MPYDDDNVNRLHQTSQHVFMSSAYTKLLVHTHRDFINAQCNKVRREVHIDHCLPQTSDMKPFWRLSQSQRSILYKDTRWSVVRVQCLGNTVYDNKQVNEINKCDVHSVTVYSVTESKMLYEVAWIIHSGTDVVY